MGYWMPGAQTLETTRGRPVVGIDMGIYACDDGDLHMPDLRSAWVRWHGGGGVPQEPLVDLEYIL